MSLRLTVFLLSLLCAFILASASCDFPNPKTDKKADDQIALQIPEKGDSFVNFLSMKFEYILPGTFVMGSPPGEHGKSKSEKMHRVTLTRGFYMQTTEVTQGQWKQVMGNNPSDFQDCGDDCPVERVSWNDVLEFIGKLNQIEGRNTYSLPTEAQWEYACRAGSFTAFANGEITPSVRGYDPNLMVIGWYKGNSENKTHPIAQMQPNAWGLYDMHGNVSEWCQDQVRNKTGPLMHVSWGTGLENSAYRDGIVDPLSTKGPERITRGGCYDSNATSCRSGSRLYARPEYKSRTLGFRLIWME